MLATLRVIRNKYKAMQDTASNVLKVTDCVLLALDRNEPEVLKESITTIIEAFADLDVAGPVEISGQTAQYIKGEQNAVTFLIDARTQGKELSWYTTRLNGSGISLWSKFVVDDVVEKLLSQDEVGRLTLRLALELLPHLYEKAMLNPGLVLGYAE